ncbi:L-ascorbate metabolism protein UlaG (beta-lactamase superfamily) [Halopolyspora algeriensis]|uniref:L-ascorbate metabolism protein UlaG (Beta-lactamase superfamily) n=1 Tax=Halopolyspora algeriensis TaxID=1500506 RepID=A0A368VU29_9ACTN|nr:MBL fold metallo-hydrolase [Halopolyspora algeriensis]RCW44696.1 L-ascorbate metabolism protein UlaG (beta-lactamase superfamily) [Halopolyspora algeriensis]TQM56053.1 L-ascorbate metabolism protein UlaG (beta-lactamase superfamily) [Halopolyspora algeriensis]
MRATMTFIGTATVLLRLGSVTLLTDPNFLHRGERAYLGYGLFAKRCTEPAWGIEQLPELDAVVLSHMHGDHFDRRARRGLARETPVLTTPHAARRLSKWGFSEAQGLHPWQAETLQRGSEHVRVTAVPAQHGPAGFHRLLPPVMGSIVDYVRDGSTELRLYITGDTLFRSALWEIPQRFPDIDAMIVHLGGTRILGVLVTMDGRQGAGLVRAMRPSTALPVHFDDYTVFRSSPEEFRRECERYSARSRIRTISRGEEVELPQRENRSGARSG